jgi:hypothetical protein
MSDTIEPKIPDVGFVACIEGGVLEKQALLLFESIRRYGGRFANCAIYACSPRVGHAISQQGRDRLNRLEVKYIDTILNTECTEYGSANRVAAAAHIETVYPHEILVVLDSDTLFLREPERILLAPDIDVAVRPVDVKGMCTEGPNDPFDSYWRELCRCCEMNYDDIPRIDSFVDRRRIKASYNGGLVITRGNLNILQRWARFFFASVREQLTPYTQPWQLRSGVSWVDPAASKFWGSNQAALSLAIWSSTQRVQELPPTYNYPLHQHRDINRETVRMVFPHLVHVHYHWLFEESISSNPLFAPDGPLSAEQVEWLRSSIGTFS